MVTLPCLAPLLVAHMTRHLGAAEAFCSLLLQVKAAAAVAGTSTFKLVGNRDIEHILDDLLHCVSRPAEVSDVVTKLSATTFVQVCVLAAKRGGSGAPAVPAAPAAQCTVQSA